MSNRKKLNFMNDDQSKIHLEPRVAKLEVGLDRLTDDVRNLALVVREQGSQMEGEIQKLVVAVTQAAGPRKTDWSVVISALLLVMAVGSAVFWPLNQTSQDNKSGLQETDKKLEEHQKMDSHPVGMALIKRVEEQIQNHAVANEAAMKAHVEYDDRQFQALDTKLQQEYALITKATEAQLTALESKVDLHNDRIYARVIKVEDKMELAHNAELNELRLWRLRAMNGDIQSKAAIGNDIIFDPHVQHSGEPATISPQPKK